MNCIVSYNNLYKVTKVTEACNFVNPVIARVYASKLQKLQVLDKTGRQNYVESDVKTT